MTTERLDPQTGRKIEEPDVHAGKVHALLAGLDCLHDTPLIFAKRDYVGNPRLADPHGPRGIDAASPVARSCGLYQWGRTMTCSSAATDAYDKTSLAITNMACAARLLLSSSPDEHTSEMGQEDRDFLLASILNNAKVADEGLDVLTPYKAADAKT